MSNEFEGQESDVIDFDDRSLMSGALRGGNDTPEMISFRRFFDQLPKKPGYFTADEFMVLGPSHKNSSSTCHKRNSFPPAHLWMNVVPLIQAMDAIRKQLGHALLITNCYRAPPYNLCVGGETNSQHLDFRAADFVGKDGDSAAWAEAARAVRDSGVFSGGIGIYRSFVHVDVRGSVADWDNR